MQHQNREQMLDMGRAISGQTKLLQHIEQSTVSGLDPARNTHLMLANAIRGNCHLIVDHPSRLRFILTLGDYYISYDSLGPHKYLSYLCTIICTCDTKQVIELDKLSVLAIEGCSMLDTLRCQFLADESRPSPRRLAPDNQMTLKPSGFQTHCRVELEAGLVFRAHTSLYKILMLLHGGALYWYPFFVQRFKPEEARRHRLDAHERSVATIKRRYHMYKLMTAVMPPSECRIV